VRSIRAARDLGLETVAIYSAADAGALHVELADHAFEIGPPPAARSYLDVGAIVDAARRTGAEAVHPRYGFLAERAELPARARTRACGSSGRRPRTSRSWATRRRRAGRHARPECRRSPQPRAGARPRRGRGLRGRRRLSRCTQGCRRRRRPGHQGGGRRGGAAPRVPPSPRAKPTRRSAIHACTSSASFRPRGTWRSRCWATASVATTPVPTKWM
jgi:hypothetical protein